MRHERKLRKVERRKTTATLSADVQNGNFFSFDFDSFA